METKICCRCKEDKPTDCYCKDKNTKDGLQRACKTCMNDSYNRSRKKKQKHYQEVAKKRRQRNTDAFREWKAERGCSYCDEDFGPALQLHHPDDNKEDNVSNLAQKSLKSMLTEAEKCIIVCGNCHVKIHHGLINI